MQAYYLRLIEFGSYEHTYLAGVLKGGK
jgi:hypothetical protein